MREFARGGVRSSPKPEKGSVFRHRRGIDSFCRLFSTHQWPNVFVSDAWPAPAMYHRPWCQLTRAWVGAPNERTSFRYHDVVVDFVDRCLSRTMILSIDICRGLGISPLRIKHLAEFSQADLRPTSGQEIFLRTFFQVWNVFLRFAHT